jgi:5-methylcytosine-specific restriction enzyme A
MGAAEGKTMNPRYIRPFSVKRDAQNNLLCVWCGKPVAKGRLKYCSDACLHEVRVRRESTYARYHVEKRDHGVCAICGIDTNAVHKLAQQMVWIDHDSELSRYYIASLFEARDIRKREIYDFPVWEMDHIVPVKEGGGACGLDGLQTLCYWCHKRKTADMLRKQLRMP